MEIIIGVFVKSLADEVELPLTNLSLSYGCTSRRILAHGNKRLTADVLVVVTMDIQNDNVKWIAFMVDHGKRSGIEHFVKIILWAGRDSNDKQVIKNFCLDVDNSNHAAKDCASAIKISVEKLKIAGLDMTNIQFHAITGNSGGGGAV
jgi:hypothetical protein